MLDRCGKATGEARAGRAAAAGLLLLVTLLPSGCGGDGESDGCTGPACDCEAVLPNVDSQADPYITVIEEFDLLSPYGERIYGMIRRPDPEQHPGLCFAAVILIPGGVNPGRLEALGRSARLLAEAGMVVVTFNAQSRADDSGVDIASEGSEDYNGIRNQETLREIILFVAGLSCVDPENIGIKSQSFGVTMAAGCLGRHPDLPVRYLVDGEGPPESFVSAHEPWGLDEDPGNDKHEIAFNELGHYSTDRDATDENLAFWQEREAIRFIGDYRGRYLRLQAEWDHAQPPSQASEIASFTQPPLWWQNKHCMDVVSAALAGGVPWVRVNLELQGNAVNATYDIDHPPVYLPGLLASDDWDVRAIIEMARMEPLAAGLVGEGGAR